jgi:hypothetical protein
VELAVDDIEHRYLAPGTWGERQINSRLEQPQPNAGISVGAALPSRHTSAAVAVPDGVYGHACDPLALPTLPLALPALINAKRSSGAVPVPLGLGDRIVAIPIPCDSPPSDARAIARVILLFARCVMPRNATKIYDLARCRGRQV